MSQEPLPTMVAIHDSREHRVWVYFVDKGRNIRWYKGPRDDGPERQASTMPYDSPRELIELFSPERGNGAAETRVFYVNEESKLQEACWTEGFNNDKWYPGALSNVEDNGYDVEPRSVLTATVFNHYMRVFYQHKNENAPCVAWGESRERGDETWTSKTAVSFN
ncbi:hypothetical protein CLAFUW4_07731 [Fulvia fulva]|uniref:Fucose-specific lectin n=1 Tax=Passalora fulva TaxID=5499 RepID=A0A9Q8LDJ7_PASFU|nr:uncharacterized protein CLAFUR5_07859 [Fulvia fulva]KAK4629501.1 hypothetical protein CLAFUR4_07736 [Fulvia fulva]KAK4630366.1 hypothetical protein CLAFUR0_07734 [Fulvia fulva]UJO15417.1 hypothetical protein CLAFUR5_07859 [Fulvia fulva]WPV12571.1 hypothetical protein CLAFUW4_07731 [Fulvia fulva]WPV27144.1 hypothetical protein CLAFUW7_07732 [Fulvia fulva]